MSSLMAMKGKTKSLSECRVYRALKAADPHLEHNVLFLKPGRPRIGETAYAVQMAELTGYKHDYIRQAFSRIRESLVRRLSSVQYQLDLGCRLVEELQKLKESIPAESRRDFCHCLSPKLKALLEEK